MVSYGVYVWYFNLSLCGGMRSSVYRVNFSKGENFVGKVEALKKMRKLLH